MKSNSNFIFFTLTLLSINSYSQLNNLTNGNIGIGTSTALENAKLTIKGNAENNWHILAFDGNTDDWFLGSFGGGGFFIAKDNFGSANSRFSIIDDKIGIGTNNPSYKLTVNSVNENHFRLENGNESAFLRLLDDGNLNLWVHGNDDVIFSRGVGAGTESMRITATGAVGIGTVSTGSHRLAVEGSIGAREIKVEASSWSDFVFENDYELRTLEEVENFIIENKHLPEIPSEAEVTENGVSLGEMNAKLLQKIEELTLYLIEQDKENKEQRELIEELQKEVSALKNE